MDAAILDLAQSGRLQGASLLVNGPSATAAVEAWRDLADPPPLTLHVCLTEGHRLPNCPDLPTGFGLLLASLLPWRRRRIAPQLRTVLLQQISRYRQLTGVHQIQLDGHQHIHLVPLVLDAVLELANDRINHLGAHDAGIPAGRSALRRLWWRSLQTGGLLKWLVLQLLSGLAIPRLRRAGLQTNRRFAGVLFSGSMFGTAFRRCWETAYSSID